MNAQTEVLEMAYEAGEMATGNTDADTRARCNAFDCAPEDAADCQQNRLDKIFYDLGPAVGLTTGELQTAFAFGQNGLGRVR